MPHHESLPTPSNPSASGITYHAAATISAPALTVWRALLDFPSYPSWNTFTPRASFPTPLAVGVIGSLDAVVGPPGTKPRLTKVMVSALEPPPQELLRAGGGGGTEAAVGMKFRVCWKARGFPTFSLRPERVMEVEVLEGGGCEVRNWETMAGPLAGVVRRVAGKGVDEGMGRFVSDLKGWVEGGLGGADGAVKGEQIDGLADGLGTSGV